MSFLALDIGTTGTKAAVLDQSGTLIRTGYAAYPTYSDATGVNEQDPRDWRQATIEAIRTCDPSGIEAVILTGQMQNVVLLDKQGDPVRPAILYSDTRAVEQAAAIEALIGRGELRARTGNDQNAGGLLAKLRWLVEHEPTVLDSAKSCFIGAADTVAYWLTGTRATDTTTASTTGLLDLTSRRLHDPAFFHTIELESVLWLLPDVVPGGSQVGQVTAQAAQSFGLPEGLPVYLAPGDAGSATVGSGSGEPGRVYGYIGTSGWVAFSADHPGDPNNGVITIAHPHPHRFIQIAPLLTAAGNWDWARTVLQVDSPNGSQSDIGDLIAAALDRPGTDLLYLPYLNGERSPFSDPHARGSFIGLSSAHTSLDMFRAVIEGVVFAYRHNLEALVRHPARSMVLTGGGARSAALAALFADCIGAEVALYPDAENVGLRGALLSVQVARGDRPDYHVNTLMSTRVVPNSAHRKRLHHLYSAWRHGYLRLRDVFLSLAVGR